MNAYLGAIGNKFLQYLETFTYSFSSILKEKKTYTKVRVNKIDNMTFFGRVPKK